ncbi:pentapeptide repeat-containing protein [Acaryochloris marina NIES-2412]|uniref:pentapeptide repeat-containing protein n=1 Tax=Acaryochloris marina TaxID=155978 RepID=UPI004059A7EB
MANEEQLSLLKQGGEVWNKWLRENPDDEINLNGADLNGIDLRGADLRGADLRGVNLRGAIISKETQIDPKWDIVHQIVNNGAVGEDFSGADLSGANLRGAFLKYGEFIGADLSGADLSGADLSPTTLTEANLSRAILSEANLSRANLCKANLSGADLRGADLSHTNLSGAKLSGIDLSRTVLSSVNFSGADLTETNLQRADLTETNLQHVDLAEANLQRASLYHADLRAANLIRANLRDADIRSANLSDANLSGANLSDVNLTEAVLRLANLSGANLSSAKLVEAKLSYADFTQANISGVNLKLSQAIATEFSGADLTGACVKDWHINSDTNFEGVKCKYIYRGLRVSIFIDRLPINPDQVFQPGEFEEWIKISAEAQQTIDLTFPEGIDWQAFFQSLQRVRQKYPDANVDLQAIEEKGTAFIIRLRTSLDADQGAIESSQKELYETQLKLLKTEARLEELRSVQQNNLEFMVKTMAENQNVTQNFNAPVGNVAGTNKGDMKAIQHNYPGEIRKTPAESAKEIQDLLLQLQQSNPTDIEALVEQRVKSDPTLRDRIRNALKEGGLETMKVILPLTGIAIETVRGWVEAEGD